MNLMILGKFGTGKTTVSDYIIDKKEYKRAMLATGLKNMANLIQQKNKLNELILLIDEVADASNLKENDIRDRMLVHLKTLYKMYPTKRDWNFKNIIKFLFSGVKPNFIKNRALLQEIGTQFREKYDLNIWVNYTYWKIVKPMLENGEKVVIDDVRFKNEFDFFREKGFIPIRVNSNWKNREKRLLNRDGVVNEDRLNHISETDLDDYGNEQMIKEIQNDFSLNELLKKIDNILKALEKINVR